MRGKSGKPVTNNIPKAQLSLSLLGEMRTDREKALPNETGGVLIGAYDVARKLIYVVYQVRAPEDITYENKARKAETGVVKWRVWNTSS